MVPDDASQGSIELTAGHASGSDENERLTVGTEAGLIDVGGGDRPQAGCRDRDRTGRDGVADTLVDQARESLDGAAIEYLCGRT